MAETLDPHSAEHYARQHSALPKLHDGVFRRHHTSRATVEKVFLAIAEQYSHSTALALTVCDLAGLVNLNPEGRAIQRALAVLREAVEIEVSRKPLVRNPGQYINMFDLPGYWTWLASARDSLRDTPNTKKNIVDVRRFRREHQ